MILNKNYFTNNDTISIAYNLIGKKLVRKHNNTIYSYKITEVEAYHGKEDKASHARFGKTERNKYMYEEGGRISIYLCYGMHWLLNITTGEKDFPAAILIRGVESILGPGKVTKALHIDKSLHGKVLSKRTGLWVEIEENNNFEIIALKRVGINYAQEYKDKLWRFRLKETPYEFIEKIKK